MGIQNEDTVGWSAVTSEERFDAISKKNLYSLLRYKRCNNTVKTDS